ncbi:hybrid sensor histidine kinase/response regulator [Chitinivibrio alkaliphilus]|uniref:histidine kinase n=1 Tax=Chitinivibrio alkaliphilus ACht1 TaxID=1313304 RepID=U7D555_9BACT|nr:response regulator [Chitinivibrio alkaliphilus]ERP31073.1 PAS/PAC sensor hybrid histidine kinase [Chitinivibrio alkaliphilus ACht1]
MRSIEKSPSPPSRHIIVVDDDHGIGELIRHKLSAKGYSLHIETTGKGAIERVIQTPKSLLLLDNTLAEMSGTEVIQRLEEHHCLPPFIIMTGQGSEELAVEMMKCGARDYLVKDIDFLDRLPTAIERIMHLLTTEDTLTRTQEALLRSEEQFKTLFMNVPVSIYIMDIDSAEIIDANPQAYKVFGYSSVKELQQNNLWDTPPYSREEVLGWIKKVCREGMQQFEWRNCTKDGNIVWEQMRLNCIEIDGIPRVLATGTDITDLKKAEAEKEKLLQQLLQSQKMESIGRLAGGIAHDFNNALGGMLGYIELAREKLPKESAIQDDLHEIGTLAQRSAKLTQQLLAFARKDVASPRLIRLNREIEKQLSMLRRITRDSVEISWTPAPHDFVIHLDPSQLSQIIMNLCINAQDAIEGSGTIDIATYAAHGSPPYASGAGLQKQVPLQKYVQLTVRDTGSGMDKTTLSSIFEPFFTTKEVGRGTGLGLSTVYGIMRQNSGFIDVESNPGTGTTFKLYFPVHEEKQLPLEEAAPKQQLPPQKKEKKVVLLVEDEPSILSTTEKILHHLGYTVIAEKNPNRAVEYVKQTHHTIDLLITDVVMLEMNGLALAKKIRQHSPHTKVLFMSGYTMETLEDTELTQNDAFIKKPFTIDSLTQHIENILHTVSK